uniref:CSON015257 protein n=1 Tax=Culicoides sonorensis TaxID=179676 RepID=A0A336LRT1_CULSO
MEFINGSQQMSSEASTTNPGTKFYSFLDAKTGEIKTRKVPSKKQANPSNWQRNIRKTANLLGKSYVAPNGKFKPAKVMGQMCDSNCRLNCRDRVTDQIRQNFFNRYYSILSLSDKYQFIIKYTHNDKIKRRSENPKHKCFRRYFIGTGIWENGGESMIRVCQTAFCRTLAISTTKVSTANKKLWNATCFDDLRGRHNKRVSQDVVEQKLDLVKDHIKTFPLNSLIPKMYEIYCEDMKKRRAKTSLVATIEIYTSIFEENFKLVLEQLKKDELCDLTDDENDFDESKICDMNVSVQNHCDESIKNDTVNPLESVIEPEFYICGSPSIKVEEALDKCDEEPVKVMTDDTKPKRKIQSDPSKWKRNLQKLANLHGISYERSDGTIKPAKKIGPYCKNCRMNCESKVSQSIREEFFKRFWQISSIDEKYRFVLRYTKIVDKKICTKENSRRRFTRLYFIGTNSWNNGNENMIKVCFRTFHNTLAISESIVRKAYEKFWDKNEISMQDFK